MIAQLLHILFLTVEKHFPIEVYYSDAQIFQYVMLQVIGDHLSHILWVIVQLLVQQIIAIL